MGGIAGHLMHLYDNRELTANEIVRIFKSASQGELVGTEKTDGFNIYLGFQDGQARAARNKGDAAKGGMTLEDLAKREFQGGPEVRQTYLNAFNAYRKFTNQLTDDERVAIFGQKGEVLYNAEIQGPAASNVVNYDKNIITIHHTGHKMYNPETDRLEGIDVGNNSIFLDKKLDIYEQAEQNTDFRVERTSVLKLRALSDDTDLKLAVAELNNAGFSGNMTINDFLEGKLRPSVDSQFGYLADDLKTHIVDRILKKEGSLGIPQIAKGLPKEQRVAISEFIKSGKALLNQAIEPIEMTVHKFSVALLSGLESAYILDNAAELDRLRSEVATAIKEIGEYTGEGAEQAHELLYKQLQKIKHHDRVNTTVEGFVFQHKDQIYKFTGNYAPVNQLLGLFKYGRGDVPAIKRTQQLNEVETGDFSDNVSYPESEKIQNEPLPIQEPKYLVLIPGGFKPPHVGHYNLVRKYLDHSKVAKIAIIIGNNARTDRLQRIAIDFNKSIKLWGEYGISEGADTAFVRARARTKKDGSLYENPFADAFDIVTENIKDLRESSLTVILGTSNKGGDEQRSIKFANSLNNDPLIAEAGVRIEVPPDDLIVDAGDVSYPQGSKYSGPISATFMREALAEGNLAEFRNHLPEHLKKQPENKIKNIMTMLRENPIPDLPSDGEQQDPTKAAPSINPAAIYQLGEGQLFDLIEKLLFEDETADTRMAREKENLEKEMQDVADKVASLKQKELDMAEKDAEEIKKGAPEEEEEVDIDAMGALDEISAMAPGAGSTDDSGDVELSSSPFAKAIRRRKPLKETTSMKSSGIAGLPGTNHPSQKNSGPNDDRKNEVDPITGKSGGKEHGAKFGIPRESEENELIDEIMDYLLNSWGKAGRHIHD